MSWICGIDPGQSGAIVFINERKFMHSLMPLKDKVVKDIDFTRVREILTEESRVKMVFLERAVPFAMGSKSAFNYGRGFMALELAIQLSGLPVTYVEPAKWTKEMHAGIKDDLKPKAKSITAVKRLYPQWEFDIPQSKNGKLHEGVVDALLIAGYGMRVLK